MEKQENPIPVEDQAPSAAAKKRIDERLEETRRELVQETEAEMSEFGQGDEVEFRDETKYESLTSHANRDAAGQEGRVVGQAFVAGSDSKHRGQVCRGVMLRNGDLVTTPERKLKKSTRASVTFSNCISQERWDGIFGKKTRRTS